MTYSLEATTSVIEVSSPQAGLAWQHAVSPEPGVVQVVTPGALIASQMLMQAAVGLVEVLSPATSLRVSSGRITASMSRVGVGSGFTDLRLNGIASFPPLTPSNPGSPVPEYPTLKPTTREFSPPIYPKSTVYTMNNRSSRYLMASKPGQAVLDLSYENVPDSLGYDFIRSYEECQGQLKPITLPDDFLSGVSQELENYISMAGSSLSWRWASPPVVDFVKAGIVNIRTSLKAYISPGSIGTAPGADPGAYIPVDYKDLTRYESFGGISITPPPPIEVGTGTKWHAYSPIAANSAGGNSMTTPAHGANGSVYVCRFYNNTSIEIYRFNSQGAVVWKTEALFSSSSVSILPFGNSFPLPLLTKATDDLFLLTLSLFGPRWMLIGFNSNGTILFQEYITGSTPSSIEYRASFNDYIATRFDIGASTVDVISINASTGAINKARRLQFSGRPGSSGSWPIVKSDGGVYIMGVSSIVELDSSLENVVGSKGFQSVTFSSKSAIKGASIYTQLKDSDICELDSSLQITRILRTGTFDPYIISDTGNKLIIDSNNGGNNIYGVDIQSLTLDWYLFTTHAATTTRTQRTYYDTVNRRALSTPSWQNGFTPYPFVSMNPFLLKLNSPNLVTPNPPGLTFRSSTSYPPYASTSPLYNFIYPVNYNVFNQAFTTTNSALGVSAPVATTLQFEPTAAIFDIISDA